MSSLLWFSACDNCTAVRETAVKFRCYSDADGLREDEAGGIGVESYAALASPEDFGLSTAAATSAYHKSFSANLEAAEQSLQLDSMPDNILVGIFCRLDHSEVQKRLALVCRRWYRLVFTPSLWHCVDIRLANLSSETRTHVNRLLTKVAAGVTRLSLFVRSDGLTGESVSSGELVPPLASLRVLDLGFNNNLGMDLLDYFIDNCPNVVHLNVEGSKKINDKSLDILSSGWPKLEAICLSHCESVTDEGIAFLTQRLKRLRMLNIDGISDISDISIEMLAENEKETLTTLNLDGEDLSDLALFALVDCKALRELTISFAESLSDTALLYLKELVNLEHLHLRKATEVTEKGLTTLFDLGNFRHLKFLQLAECNAVNDGCVDAITKCCPYLRSLCLSWCWSVTEKGFRHIIERLHDLRLLDLVGMDLIKGQLLAHCPQLYLPKLAFLDLQKCHVIEDTEVHSLVLRRRGLVVVNYYGEFLMAVEKSPAAACLPLIKGVVCDDRDNQYELRAEVKRFLQASRGGCCMTAI